MATGVSFKLFKIVGGREVTNRKGFPQARKVRKRNY